MTLTPHSNAETKRQRALRQYKVLDTAPEAVYDQITKLASIICGTPISLVTLLDAERQWFKSKVGTELNETSRELSFCNHTVADPNSILHVPDMQADARFADHPLVTAGLQIRFYAGVPLRVGSGDAIGTLCVLDTVPRNLSLAQLEALKLLADQVVTNIEARDATELQLLANALPQLVWIADETGWINWYNDRWYAYTGTTFKDMEGWGWQSVHDPEILPSVMEKWQASIATGHPFELVFPLRGADGIFRPFLTRVNPIHDNDGNIIKWFGTNTDITFQYEAEAQAIETLRHEESERTKLLALIENAPDYIGMADIEGRLLYHNQAAKIMIGRMNDDFSKLTIADMHPAWAQKILHEHALPTVYDKGVWRGEVALLHKDGHEIPVNQVLTLYRDKSGTPICLTTIMQDISERKAAEKSLQKTNEFFDLMMENIPDIVFVKDKDFRIVKANKAFFDIFPADIRDTIIGTTMVESFLPEDADNFLKYDRQAFLEGSSETIEIISLPNVGVRHIFTKKVRFEDANSDTFILGIARDITELKKAEEYRSSLLDQLTQSNSELERFAYVASHDMQEPLRMIANFSSLIAEEYSAKLDEAALEYISIVKDSADRMQHMIEDLLDYSRVKNDQRIVTKVDANLELAHVLQNLSSAINERRAVVTHDQLPNFAGNPVQFMRLLQNFIGNGLKYQKADNTPIIHIGVTDEGDYWCFSIKDNGIGINADFINEVFEPFKRLHAWDEYKGSGIGLAVCKQIVESHGGKVWVNSTLNQGSTFYFTIAKRHRN